MNDQVKCEATQHDFEAVTMAETAYKETLLFQVAIYCKKCGEARILRYEEENVVGIPLGFLAPGNN